MTRPHSACFRFGWRGRRALRSGHRAAHHFHPAPSLQRQGLRAAPWL